MLTVADPVILAADHPSLNAQRVILDAVSAGYAEFGVYHGSSARGAAFIADIAAIGGRILAYATRAELETCLPADIVGAYIAGLGFDQSAVRRSRVIADSTAGAAAVAVTAAWEVLSAASVAEAGDRQRWLVASGRSCGIAVRASMLGWGRGISVEAVGVQLAALRPFLSPSDQLRYRTGSLVPRRPASD